jgi:hypothetical protein
MKLLPNDVYLKIKQLDHDVKEKLRHQGIVVPKKNNDGTISVGRFKIAKSNQGFYSVLDYANEAIVEMINLPQTAAVVANKLALGKFLDDDILDADRRYGHALFEEVLHKHLGEKSIKKQDLDAADVMFTKASISKSKKDKYRREVVNGFEKLIRFR